MIIVSNDAGSTIVFKIQKQTAGYYGLSSKQERS